MAKKKSSGGRPQFKIEWKEVTKLCVLQCSQEEIAWYMGCSLNTIERGCVRDLKISFGEFYRQKRSMGRSTLRRRQWEAAQKGNVTMLIWLGKQYLNQSDTPEPDEDDTELEFSEG